MHDDPVCHNELAFFMSKSHIIEVAGCIRYSIFMRSLMSNIRQVLFNQWSFHCSSASSTSLFWCHGIYIIVMSRYFQCSGIFYCYCILSVMEFQFNFFFCMYLFKFSCHFQCHGILESWHFQCHWIFSVMVFLVSQF